MNTRRYPGWLAFLYWNIMRPHTLRAFREGLAVPDTLQLHRATAWLASLLLFVPAGLSALIVVFNPSLTPDQFPRTGGDSPYTIVPRLLTENTMLGILVVLVAFTCLALLTYRSLIIHERAGGLLMLIVLLASIFLYLNVGPLWGVQLYGGVLPGVILGIDLGLSVALSLIVTSSITTPINWRNVIYGGTLTAMGLAPIAGLPLSGTMKAAYPANSTDAFLITYFGIVVLGFALYLRNKRILQDETAFIVSKRGHPNES